MNFTTLQYFLVAAEKQNLTRAASELYISQQALSHHISKLEEELGVTVFDRNAGFTLTYAGRQLQEYAKNILSLERQIRQTAGDISNNRKGELRLGISHTCGRAILPYILPEYHRDRPMIDISLYEGNSEELENRLHRGELDLIISYETEMRGIKTEKLMDERLFLAVPKEMLSKYFGACESTIRNECKLSLDISLFERMPFILLTKGNRVRNIFDEYAAKIGFKPNIILETENIETAFALAQRGMGLTAYPELFRWCMHRDDTQGDDTMDFFPMYGHDTTCTLIAGTMEGRYRTQAVEDFIALCSSVFKTICAQSSERD